MLSAMAHRPYPVRDRALRQILRRHRYEIPATLLPTPRELQGAPGDYVLSTRRPGVVSGGS